MSVPRYESYRESGVEWLGEVPAHWCPTRLRYAVTITPSKTELSGVDRSQEVSFLPMDAIGEDGSLRLTETRAINEVETGYTYFREGDVVVAKITPCFENGKGAIMRGLQGGVGFGTTELIVARPKGQNSAAFLHWLFCSPLFRLRGEAFMYGAGGQKRVPDDFLRDFSIGLPPPSEQIAIAAFLDRETAKIDALVEEQRRLIALLAEKRQAVISHAVTKGLDPTVPMKDSGVEWLGEVPAHWEVLSVRRLLADITQGWSPECLGRPAEEEEWGVLKAGCVNGGVFNPEENKCLPEALEPLPEYEVQPGDILMSRASGSPGLVGACAFVQQTPPHIMLSDKIYRIRLSDGHNSQWFATLMGAAVMRAQIVRAISGAEGLANNLPQSSLKAFFCTVPPIREQSRIYSYIKMQLAEFHALTVEAQAAITLLQERRAALISAAVTGKIDVRGLAPAAAEAA